MKFIVDYELYCDLLGKYKNVIQVSFPRSGRYWLGNLISEVTSANHIGILPFSVGNINEYSKFYITAHLYRSAKWENITKYVLLIRDPRDAMLSHAYWRIKNCDAISVFPDFGVWARWSGEWIRYFDVFLPMNTIVIQYEKLVLFPCDTIKRIVEFSGFGFAGDVDIAIQEFDRKNYKSNYERYQDCCLKWRCDDNFIPEYHKLIQDICGRYMVHWGYNTDGHSANLLTL